MADESYAKMYLREKYFPKNNSIKDTFYYDETNNIRKFVLRENGFNNDISNAYFILGGIVVPNDVVPNIDILIKKLDFPKENKELKFKNFVGRKKTIDGILRSKKINILLTWLINEKLYIHYFIENFLYFSIVDIVDSLPVDEASQNALFILNRSLKNALYTEVFKDLNSYLELLYEYGYPNIKKGKIKDFVSNLYDIYFANYEGHDSVEDFPKEMLRQMMKQARKNDELVFLEDNEDYILVENFYINYISQMLRFPNSNHIFDSEVEVEGKINVEHNDLSNYVSYCFVDSKTNHFIQLSDVIVGLISQILSFIEYRSIEEIREFMDNLDNNGLEIISRLNKLITMSDEITKLTLCFIGADDSINKINFFYDYAERLAEKIK